MTWKEFIDEVIYHFLVENKKEIGRVMQQNMLKRKETRKQHDLFFFKNELKRLFLQVEWQYRQYGTVNHEVICEMIDRAIQRYELLDDKTKKQLQSQKNDFIEYKNKKYFETKFENLAPKMIRRKELK